jgi:serine/threonine protein phosphatase PrpC
MEIKYILEKGSGNFNEDFLIMEKNLFGVFDGASSLDHARFEGGQTGGMIASQTAGKVFSKNHFPLKKLGVQANQAILSGMKTQNVNLAQRHTLWSTSAAVVRIKDNTLEWLQTGDAQVILLYTNGSHKTLTNRYDHDYETLMMLKEHDFKLTPSFNHQVQKVRSRMNKTYGVLNGEPDALKFVKNGFISLNDVETILLFTDGLQIPASTPSKKKNFDKFIKLYRNLGLESLKNHIRAIEAKDPEVKSYPRFKCHDDMAAIAIDLI